MKRVIAFFMVLAICLSMCACGATEKAPTETVPELTEEDKAALELVKDAVSYLKNQLVLPESFTLTSASYILDTTGETLIKIAFSAKNSYGGVIDTAAYFAYDGETKAFSDSYQARIDVAEANGALNAVQRAQDMLKSGDVSEVEEDQTSVYIEKAYFLKASEFTKSSYNIWSSKAKEIDTSYVK